MAVKQARIIRKAPVFQAGEYVKSGFTPHFLFPLRNEPTLCKNGLGLPGLFRLLERKRTSCMKVGDRVRVKKSVMVYHHPNHRNEPFDVKGLEGEVSGIVVEWHGRPVSANLPVLVQFDKKFRVHFREDEVEIV